MNTEKAEKDKKRRKTDKGDDKGDSGEEAKALSNKLGPLQIRASDKDKKRKEDPQK
jgi:hypothetical protein